MMGEQSIPQHAAGKILGHYRIVEKIGAGGMGEVYRAHDEHLARDVAIKVLPPGTLIDESARKHFHKEALILSQLSHPNIATIYDFDTQQGVDFLVMEYIPGITLSEKVAGRALAEKEVLRLGVQLAEGLAAAHEHGVVHRDLKPGNLQVTSDGRLKILDFGLAKLRLPVTDSAATESFSEAHAMAGTVPYMAPEQLLGGEIDTRTDIHAAGSVLYEMATGLHPFADVEHAQLIGAILHRPPRSLSTLNPRVSPELERIIGKCLEKEPENRYQSAKELAVDLRRMVRLSESGELAARAHNVGWWTSIGRHKGVVVTATCSVAFLLLGTWWLIRAKQVEHAARVPPSIAVLPFADLSAEKDQEYFSDGLAEELLNSLAKIPGLRVAARTSSFQFKGKNEDLKLIADKLNVATVLEGSVRKQGQRLRISAQLIQVSDGFELWSEAYDRDETDIFAVQENIARSVADSLKLKLLGQQTPASQTTSMEAYNAYLQGRYYSEHLNKESMEKALAYYEQAIKLDPNYAPAWAALSMIHNRQLDAFGSGFQISSAVSLQDEVRKAREAAERALALDPNLAEGYAAMGAINQRYDWDWAAANANYQRALDLEPGNARFVALCASLAATLNHFDEALRLSRKAIELDPLRAGAYNTLAFIAWWSGHLDEAEAAVRKGLELDPQYGWLEMLLARVYLARSRPQEALVAAERDPLPGYRLQGIALANYALGRRQESDRALAQLIKEHQGDGAFLIAEVFAYRGEADSAFAWLERAYKQREEPLSEMKGDPLLEKLEPDPRHAAFLKKMNLL